MSCFGRGSIASALAFSHLWTASLLLLGDFILKRCVATRLLVFERRGLRISTLI